MTIGDGSAAAGTVGVGLERARFKEEVARWRLGVHRKPLRFVRPGRRMPARAGQSVSTRSKAWSGGTGFPAIFLDPTLHTAFW